MVTVTPTLITCSGVRRHKRLLPLQLSLVHSSCVHAAGNGYSTQVLLFIFSQWLGGPRAISGRIASSCWWFFTLIIVSFLQPKNLAALLTLAIPLDMPNTNLFRYISESSIINRTIINIQLFSNNFHLYLELTNSSGYYNILWVNRDNLFLILWWMKNILENNSWIMIMIDF